MKISWMPEGAGDADVDIRAQCVEIGARLVSKAFRSCFQDTCYYIDHLYFLIFCYFIGLYTFLDSALKFASGSQYKIPLYISSRHSVASRKKRAHHFVISLEFFTHHSHFLWALLLVAIFTQKSARCWCCLSWCERSGFDVSKPLVVTVICYKVHSSSMCAIGCGTRKRSVFSVLL